MRTTLLTLATIFLAFTTICAEDITPDLPSGVIRALDRFDADLYKAQERYRKEADDAKADAAKALDREMKKAVRAGDLDLANAIKAKQEALAVHTAGGLEELDFLGEKMARAAEEDALEKSIQEMTGKWSCRSGLSGNTFATEIKGNKWEFGKGFSIKVDRKNKSVTMKNTEHEIVFPLPVTDTWIGTHTGGSKYVLTRIKE